MKKFTRPETFFWIKVLGVVLIASLIRIPYLGTLPEGVEGAFWFRLPIALAAVLSIVLMMVLVNKLSQDHKLAIISGLVMTFMPWHIEQSRVYSEAMLGMTAILASLVLWVYVKNNILKTLGVLSLAWLFYQVYPSFWPLSGTFSFPSGREYLSNIFKLNSVEFLFYKNDSFWWGGLRSRGTMLPSMLPVMLAGLLVVVCRLRIKTFILAIIPFVIVVMIASAHPQFPEQSELFMISPYYSIILACGIVYMFEQFKSTKIIKKIVISAFILLIFYDYIVFHHFYTTHYAQRVKQEAVYAKNKF